MSSRAVRKALKRIEAQKALEKEPQIEAPEDADDDDDDVHNSAAPSNPFAMLNDIEEPEEDEPPIAVEEAPSASAAKGTSTPSKKSKHKKKKRKAVREETLEVATPSEAPSTPSAQDLDDVDRAIQEISQKYGDTSYPSSTPNRFQPLSKKLSLLSVSSKYLDADHELRKLFGKIVDAEAREARRQPIRGIPPRIVNRIKASQVRRKSTLMKPKDEWQLFTAYNKGMLSMDVISKEEGVTKFKFVHSRKYHDAQLEFFFTALGGDGDMLMALLHRHPFHVDTCIQVSDILRHQGSLSEAADLIERALFSLDCGLHPMFNISLGTTRLPFEYFENRCFYLAVWHHIESLGKRGCWRTCLEFNKLLFAMEPEENPYAALLSIDYAAIKAREYSYLIDLRDSKEWIDETGWLLNIHYTAALAEYMSEKDQKKDHTKSSESLSETIKRFPWLVAQLYYALKLKFPQEFPTTIPSSPLQALYTDLYIHRAKDLWAVPEISIWLQSVVTDVALQVVQPPPSQTLSHIPMNVARHLLVMNVPALMGHIPREYSSRTQLAIDPLPPENSISPYDAPMREMQETVRDETALGRLVARLMRRQPPDMDGIELDDADFEGPDENDDDYYTDEELTDEFSDEDNEGLVSQLTNTIRNAFRWLGGREEQPEERDAGDEEPLD